jgi:hypothetical protein
MWNLKKKVLPEDQEQDGKKMPHGRNWGKAKREGPCYWRTHH